MVLKVAEHHYKDFIFSFLLSLLIYIYIYIVVESVLITNKIHCESLYTPSVLIRTPCHVSTHPPYPFLYSSTSLLFFTTLHQIDLLHWPFFEHFLLSTEMLIMLPFYLTSVHVILISNFVFVLSCIFIHDVPNFHRLGCYNKRSCFMTVILLGLMGH
jgi:hypothetical protein